MPRPALGLAHAAQAGAILDFLTEGVLLVDSAGVVKHANSALRRMLGRTLEKLQDPAFDSRYRIRRADGTPLPLDEQPAMVAIRTGQPVRNVELSVLLEDGTTRRLVANAQPIRGTSSHAAGAVVSLVDVTERRQMQEQTRLLHEQKLESLGRLASGIAHDFNNLLCGVFGNIDLGLLRLRSGQPERAMAFLEESRRALDRARGLSQQLLTFAKGGEPVRVATDVGTFTRDTLRLVLSGSSLHFEVSVAPGLWPAEIDRAQIGQVFDNLAVNARQAMPRGGVLRVDVRNLELGADGSLPLAPGRYLQITCVDNGPGIAAADLGRIFDPFFTTRKDRGNTGLGLSTAHSIVSRHGGHISAESAPGQGATFRIYLPASAVTPPSALTGPGSPNPLTGRRILVMDDEAAVRHVTAALLRHSGADVTAVPNGAAAVAAYAAARAEGRTFDLAILDLTIPGEAGGRDVLKRLKATHPDVRAVAISGYSDDPIMSRPREFGFAGALAKPHTLDELERALCAVLERR
jgi:PAS domain S-box-containing protein